MRQNVAVARRVARNLGDLAERRPTDARGNAHLGRAVLSDTERTAVHSSASGRLIITQGVQDLVIVDMPGATLIAHRAALPGPAASHAGGGAGTDPARKSPGVEATPWGYVVSLPEHDSDVLYVAAGAALPAEAVHGRTVRLVSGFARVEPAAAGDRPLSQRRATRLADGAQITSTCGCTLVVETATSRSDPPAEDARIAGPADCPIVDKPWGREVWWAVAADYAAKRLDLRAGHALSLQYHERKHETLYFLSGRVRLRLGEDQRVVGRGHVAIVPPGTVHRMEALTDAVIFEVSTPHLDDVVRMEDRYGRAAAEMRSVAVTAGTS